LRIGQNLLQLAVIRAENEDDQVGAAQTLQAGNLRRIGPRAKILRHDGLVPQSGNSTAAGTADGLASGDQRADEDLHDKDIGLKRAPSTAATADCFTTESIKATNGPKAANTSIAFWGARSRATHRCRRRTSTNCIRASLPHRTSLREL
jgi:hypothetical protein